jgi:hypothetical protein
MSKLPLGIRLLAIVGALYGTVLLVAWAGRILVRWQDTRNRPWAYSIPTLLGTWQGDAQSGDVRLRLVLSLTRNRASNRFDGADIKGQAVLCDSSGRVQSYSLWALVTDPRGHTVDVHLLSIGGIPGLRLAALSDMTWDGGAVLRAKASLLHGNVGGSYTTYSTDRPVPFLLHPVGDSAKACVAAENVPPGKF